MTKRSGVHLHPNLTIRGIRKGDRASPFAGLCKLSVLAPTNFDPSTDKSGNLSVLENPDRRRHLQTSNDPLPLKHGSNRPETWPKRVSDDPRHFIFRRSKSQNFAKKNLNFRTAVYPPRIARIGPKLGQNAFQIIPDISSFDPETRKFFGFFVDFLAISPCSGW